MLRDAIDYRGTAVRKLFLQFLFPTVLGMASAAVFIITDGVFVGRGIGSDALAAVNLVAPLYTFATGLGLMFGIGGSVVASINLARGKTRVASINVTQAVVIPTLLMVVVSGVILLFRQPILFVLGTLPELMQSAGEYLFWFTLFLTPITLFTILMFFVRLDGAPRFAMTCNMLAAGINILLDYLFIFPLGWGLAGAAVATGIGSLVSVGLMLWYLLRRSRTLHLLRLKTSRKSMALTLRNLGYISYVGFPALLGELAISSMMIAGNYAFAYEVGKDGVAAYSIACYIFPIIFMIYNGIVQAAQPIISYNYGAGLHVRAQHTFRLSLRTAVLCGTIVLLFTWFYAHWVVGLFISSDQAAYRLAVEGLPLFALGYIFFGINLVTIGYYQSIERGRLALALTALRGIVLMTCYMVLLPRWWGAAGIWLAVPAAELTESLLLGVLLMRMRRKT